MKNEAYIKLLLEKYLGKEIIELVSDSNEALKLLNQFLPNRGYNYRKARENNKARQASYTE